MTKEFNKAATAAGAFLRWFEMAIATVDDAIKAANISFFKRIAVKLALRKIKKHYKKCDKDFKKLIDELEKLDGEEGAKERAEKVYKTIQRTFVHTKVEFDQLNTIINLIKFAKGGLNARD